MSTQEPYYLALQTGVGAFTTACGVEIPIWNSQSFHTATQAADAIATYCGHDPETVERMKFVILEVGPAPR